MTTLTASRGPATRAGSTLRPSRAAALRLVGGVLVVGVLLWRLGTTPVLHGIRTVDGWSLAAAAGLVLVTTVCSALRWRLVASALDVPIGKRAAVAACYRAQFLNVTLPGGLLGDVHRGMRQGRATGQLGRSLRAVAWERTAGQVVQLVIVAVVILVLPSPLDGRLRLVGGAGLAVLLAVAVVTVRARSYAGEPRWARVVRRDLRSLLRGSSAAPGGGVAGLRPALLVLGLSVAVVAGHVATFAVAARATGTTVPLVELVPVALVVLLAAGLPVNLAGWGPREGVAAGLFAAAGWGAAEGLATAVAYGVLVFVATLPGAAVLAGEGVARG